MSERPANLTGSRTTDNAAAVLEQWERELARPRSDHRLTPIIRTSEIREGGVPGDSALDDVLGGVEALVRVTGGLLLLLLAPFWGPLWVVGRLTRRWRSYQPDEWEYPPPPPPPPDRD